MFAPRYYASRYFARRYFPRGASTTALAVGLVTEPHKFGYAVVPSFKDMDEVQRFLQRAFDDLARVLNPVKSVADGGTGIEALERGEILAGGEAADAFTRVKGNSTTTRMFLVSEGNGVVPGVPFWSTLQDVDTPVVGNRVLVGTDLVKVGTSQVVTP